MLFGNNYGLLEYNGKDWGLIVQPSNKTVIRSLHKSKNGIIFLGAQSEFGFIKTNDAGQNQYVSLLPKVPVNFREFGDVWAILETTSGIYFHTVTATYRYFSDTVFVLKTPPLSSFSKIGDSILVQDQFFDIHVLKPDGLNKVFDGENINNYVLKIYDDQHGGMQFVTQKEGILRYTDGEFKELEKITNSFLENNKIQSLHKLRDDYLAIGSVGAGLLILDEHFNPIQWLNKSNGLQSNTILAMGADHIGNLWVATETGIDYVEISTPLYQIADNYNLEGTVSSVVMTDNVLYVGTNTGVFYSQWNNHENPIHPTLDFRQVPGLSGQVWNIYTIDSSIYVCHHEGLFKIEGNRTERLFEGPGAWNLLPMEKNSLYYLQGAYNGIHLYELKNGTLSYLWKINGFDETSRIIEADEKGNIWMAHGYKGIYRLKLSSDMKYFSEKRLYKKENGFPTSLFINLFKIKNKILFGTEYGTYQYNHELDSMVLDPLYTRILGNEHHIRLLQEDDGDVWFVKGHDMHDDMGVIDFYDNEKFEVVRAPLQHLRGKFNPGFENITVLDKNTILFGTKNGLVLLDRNANRNHAKPYNALLTEVRSTVNDSLLYGQVSNNTPNTIKDHIGTIKLPYNHNSLSFSYANNYFESPENTTYSYYMEGFDKGWYDWKKEQYKSYTNLPPGQYTFHVKAQNVYGVESKEGRYSFIILPPWYLTSYAKLFYGIMATLLGVVLLKAYRLRIERVQKKERLAQLEVLRKNQAKYHEEKLLTEQELIKLRNEKLEAQIAISRSKMEVLNTEMAASIMMITQKNGMLIKVRDDLRKLLKKVRTSNRKPIERVIKEINQDINTDQDWEQFKIHFDKVHEDFLERLKTEFPEITAKDLQLAAYLRLNLSSKEIASMMNITIRSIEGCRYRLRKHLKLSGDTNLNEFILKF